jgi:hypothetical protein
MTFLIIKALLSGLIIAIVSEVSRKAPALGALIVSLPLVSLLAMMWMWNETQDTQRIARSRTGHVLVRAAIAADVSGIALAVARRLRLLAISCWGVRDDHRALCTDGVGAFPLWHHSVRAFAGKVGTGFPSAKAANKITAFAGKACARPDRGWEPVFRPQKRQIKPSPPSDNRPAASTCAHCQT